GLRHLYYRIIGGFTFHHTTSLLHDSPQHSWWISIFIYYHYEFKNVNSKATQDLSVYLVKVFLQIKNWH
ncbi:hypothetical protein ACTM9V_15850, partial [Oliverpabstia intestinalis]|uniref:hypothetical protein n=1 Tax=Oliverpabstia intestinalis TaxID=2606633 RepID=UPI003F88CDB3